MADVLISEYVEGSSLNKAIELYNTTDSVIDLGAENYTIELYSNGASSPSQTLNLTGRIDSKDVFVITRSNADAAIQAVADITDANSVINFNGDDAIVVKKNGTIVDVIGQIGFDPGSEWGSGDTSTRDNTIRRKSSVSVGDTNPNDAFEPSVEWDGFAQDTFDGLGSYDSDDNNGGSSVKIYEIQGTAHTSPLVGQSVTTTGIVTAVDSNGFYLQDPTGDDNDATSDAIFVFTGAAPGVAVGDDVEVSGTVSEFTPGGTDTGNLSTTQISGSPTVTVNSSGNPIPAATIIGSGGRVPPTENIDDDAFSSFDPTTDGIDFFESLEGMLVTAKDTVAVSPTSRFGEIFTVVDNGDNATGVSDRGTLNISPDDFNPEKVQIDADSDILPGFEFPEVNTGAQLGDVTGVVSYSFGNFEINPTQAFTVTPSTIAAETTNLEADTDKLTVASYNLLNIDPNDADGDTDVANGRFDAIANQVVNNLKTPDIIGLQEIQDNTGSADDGVTAADQTLQQLVDAIVAAGGPEYEFIDNTFIGNNTSGGQPGGNIRTGFLYNPARVGFVEDSLSAVTDATAQQTDSSNPFFDSRLPLAGKFTFNGEEVTVVNNHFSSKGGSSPILGVEQPFEARQEDPTVNGSLDERQAQAQAVKDYVDGILTADSNANVVVLGDLNEFEFVSPVETLAENLTNLTNTLPEDERYSFIFQGNSQSLDHILVSDNLADTAEFDILHVNSEFTETPERASDHDPLVASLSIPKENMESNQINLSKIGTFTSEDGAEIVAHDPTTQRLFITTGDTVEVIDISDPASPTKVKDIDITSVGGGANSVAVNNGIVAVAVEADPKQDNGVVAFYDADGNSLGTPVTVGPLPDMLTFSPDGNKILVANEGEPNDDYTVDPEGSISIIDISAGVDSATVTTASFNGFDDQKEALINKGVRIFGPDASVSQDLEPEYIAVSPDGSTAFVTLQENNAVAVVDIETAAVQDVLPLGVKDHSLEGNQLDASNKDDAINIQNWPVFGLYQPDAIDSFEVDGKTYYITANEGDARDYDAFSEEARVKDLTLDPTVFPNAATLQEDENLGRLKTTTTLGDTDGDGDVDQIFSYGGRSFSIWDEFGNQVFDSGDQIAKILEEETPNLFNADFDDEVLDANGNLDFSDNSPSFGKDDRSDDKGAEPESVTVGTINGKPYGFVGLERAGGGVLVYELSDPTAPEFVQYIRTEGDVAPEGLKFIAAEDSPNGNPVLAVANEVSKTTTLYDIELPTIVTADVDGRTIEGIDLTAFTTDKVTVDFTISREADFDNEVYFYKVDDITGSVGGVAVGTDGYLQAALENIVSPEFSTSDDNTETGSVEFEAGSLVVPMLIADGSLEEAQSGDATVYLPYLGANGGDNFDHIKLLDDGSFGFEDLPNGGDRDFNDITIKINSIA